MSKKYKVYSVRLNLKNINPQIKVVPRSLTGVAIANSAEEAGDASVKAIHEKLLSDRTDVYAVVGKVSIVPSRFILHAEDWTE